MAARAGTDAIRFEHDGPMAAPRELPGGRKAREPRADDEHACIGGRRHRRNRDVDVPWWTAPRLVHVAQLVRGARIATAVVSSTSENTSSADFSARNPG